METEVVKWIVFRVLAVIGILLYFLPTFVARKENKVRAFILNLFLGWTLVGWVVAMYIGVRNDYRRSYVDLNDLPSNRERMEINTFGETEGTMRARIRREEMIRMEERAKLKKEFEDK